MNKDINIESSPRDVAEEIVRILDSKKGKNIKMLRIEDKTVLADYFVICGGTSNTQIRALAGEVEEKLAERGITPNHSEGFNEGTWTVLDYGSVIVHIFIKETRDFYKLEKLWSDAEDVDISSLLV